MNRYDLTPLFRSSVGFDHISRLMDLAFEASGSDQNYPPYNIEKLSDETYLITMAVAGFEQDDINVSQHGNMLVVKGGAKAETPDEQREFLHRGIATRSFERRFTLSDHVNVTSAHLNNGLLQIGLLREVPEHKKPRTITISDKKANLFDNIKKRASA